MNIWSSPIHMGLKRNTERHCRHSGSWLAASYIWYFTLDCPRILQWPSLHQSFPFASDRSSFYSLYVMCASSSLVPGECLKQQWASAHEWTCHGNGEGPWATIFGSRHNTIKMSFKAFSKCWLCGDTMFFNGHLYIWEVSETAVKPSCFI